MYADTREFTDYWLRTPDLEGGHKVGADDSLDLSQLCRAKSRMDDNQSRNF